MSRHVKGPLVETSASDVGQNLMFPAPVKHCPECGARLAIVAGWFHGGIHSGVTWILHCPDSETYYEWGDYHCAGDDNYDCGTSHPEPVQ